MSCLRFIFTASHFHHAFQEPELDIDSVALNAWKRGQLTNAEALLSTAIPTSKNRHHVLAGRALVRARLGQWDAALVDAKEVHVVPLSHTWTLTPFRTKSIQIQRSFVGYVAKCGSRWQRGKGRGNSGVRHFVPPFSFEICCLSFSHQDI